MPQISDTQEAKRAEAVDYLAYMFYIVESDQTYEAMNATITAYNALPEQLRRNYRSLARTTLSEIETILNR